MLILAGALLIVCACKGYDTKKERVISPWQVSYIQTPDKDVALQDASWTPIELPSLFCPPRSAKKDVTHAWLKSDVEIDNPENLYGISLGRIYFSDRVYVNDKLCGEHGNDGIREFHFPRNYILPQDSLKKGKNRIMVYLGIYGREYGGIHGHVSLLSKDLFVKNAILENMLFLQIPLGVIILYGGMIILVALSYEKGKNGPPVVILMGIICVWLTHLFMIYSPYQPVGMEFRVNCLWLCTYINSIFFIAFIQYNFRYFFTSLNRIIFPLIGFFALVTLLFNNTTAPFYPGRIFGVLNLLLTNLVSVYMLLFLQKIRRSTSTRLFWLFGYLPSLAISMDILNYLYGSHVPPLYHVYVIPLMNILVILLYRQQIIFYRTRLKKLSEQITVSPVQNKHDRDKFVPTVQLESKLQALKEHIDTNFRSPLTREILAEKMDLNPDYMGRMFKVHVGVKINNYINDLRVDAACRMLQETNSKIIDIAFAVGFESLATFNRVFIKKTGISPSEYRMPYTYNDQDPSFE
ncbi:MAG: helix-turn-helix transcriptional regulator [Proteobacteria bacterium]|nr:helix-turn-helix transcriptional regulator [Pseudomonadota bacterium]